jgi:ABC-2 type transport system ATP-binding protein
MSNPVQTKSLTKRFGGVVALDAIDISIAKSQIVGLIGTNGSGKSTLLKHITGQWLPTSGECFTFGKPARDLDEADLTRIGVVRQHEEFSTWMNVEELCAYVGSFYPSWDSMLQQRLMDSLELHPYSAASSLSPGNRQRLALLLATCHHPELLLLDEPLSDLDTLARDQVINELLAIYRDDGPTIVISSHLLHDIERMIDHVICLDRGKVLVDASLDSLKEKDVPHGSGEVPFNLERIFTTLVSARDSGTTVTGS